MVKELAKDPAKKFIQVKVVETTITMVKITTIVTIYVIIICLASLVALALHRWVVVSS